MKSAVCKILSISGLTAMARLVNRRKASILMYHGITRDRYAADWTQVYEADFKAQMKYIVAKYHVVALSELINGLQENRLAQNSVAITFDDGFMDFFTRRCSF